MASSPCAWVASFRLENPTSSLLQGAHLLAVIWLHMLVFVNDNILLTSLSLVGCFLSRSLHSIQHQRESVLILSPRPPSFIGSVVALALHDSCCTPAFKQSSERYCCSPGTVPTCRVSTRTARSCSRKVTNLSARFIRMATSGAWKKLQVRCSCV